MKNWLAAFAVFAAFPVSAESLWVGRFPAGEGAIPAPWQIERIDQRVPATRYRLRTWDSVNSIEAHARKSMALLARPLEIDLRKTPFLCWQWRIDAPLLNADMSRKSGDDYAARVYLTFDLPADQLSFTTRAKLALARSLYGNQVPDAALNYVWDNSHPVGTLQDNAYTDRARLLVLRSGGASAGHWVRERRNALQDFQRAFGPIGNQLRALVLASDTDNTGEEAHAGFADFRFVANEAECPEASVD
ncbi:MAG: DUF3047 domain-containing protein [Betaproteobacteria bacterium]